MASSNNSYPSPSANHGLPFYQQHPQQEPQAQQHDDGAMQHGGAHDLSEMGINEHREVPQDPQMRDNVANLIGTFGNFGALPAQMVPHGHHPGFAATSTPTQMPANYASAGDSPDQTPQSANPHKEKRSKVSRACDECRRKKIRCDALDESASVACTNCSRSGAACAFSRQPLKRGPSKGYINALAERLNTLEQQVQLPPHLQQQHQHEIQEVQRAMAQGSQGFAPDARSVQDPRLGDKRSYDAAEGAYDEQRRGLSSAGDQVASGGRSQFAPNPYQQASGGAQPFWRQGGENRQDGTGLAFEADSSTAITGFDWDEAVVDEYYRIIHQTFPLLPSNKNRLRQRLAECPASLREAFLAALDCLMRTFPTTSLPPNPSYPQALKRTAELLARYPFDNPSSHSNATNLVYLQTLLLMALESDNHGPATIRGQAGPSRAEWLGRAAGVAGQLEINLIRTGGQSIMEGDRDSEERLARRVWWVLFILDRWHASSTADLLKLPENSVVLLPEDQILLGESTYHLARLSFIIGHLAAILTTTKTPSTDVMSPSNPASSLLGLTLAGEIDRFRESVESVWGSLNLVHLSYHHCHLLIKRLNPTTEPSELVGHAVKVATVLNSRLTPVTPLNHHFGALAAMTLCELCDVPKTRVEAMKGLDQMIECLGEGLGLAGRQESEGWDGAVRELVKKKKENMLQQADGLHNLADAAVGSEEAKFDPTMLTRYGYLTSLGQGVFGRTSF